MAAAVRGSRADAGKKLKHSLKKKKKKMVAGAVVPEVEEKVRGASDSEGSVGSVESEADRLPDDGAAEADSEDNAEPCGGEHENADAAASRAGPSAGWADAMAKILKKRTPAQRPAILLHSRELEKEKEQWRQERLQKRQQLDKKREWEMLCRVKPDVVKDKETERNLQRIATRGVVQLFNAVQKHQKKVDEKVKEAGGSMRKRAKLMSTVSKKDFISVLRGLDGSTDDKASAGTKPKAKQSGAKAEEGPSWKILRDDFMMGASMKDWDKESDGPEDSRPGSASDSDA